MADAPSVLKPRLNTFDTSMIVVSLVIGIGIFRTPALVAMHTGSMPLFFRVLRFLNQKREPGGPRS